MEDNAFIGPPNHLPLTDCHDDPRLDSRPTYNEESEEHIDLGLVYDEETNENVEKEIVEAYFKGSQIEMRDLSPLIHFCKPTALAYSFDEIDLEATTETFQLFSPCFDPKVNHSTSTGGANQALYIRNNSPFGF